MKLVLVNRQVILPESGTESFQCHASTLVRLPCGTLVAAWFAGLREGSEDTAIWLSVTGSFKPSGLFPPALQK